MEFLKDLFGDNPLTYDQFAQKVGEKDWKLVNLSSGGYVGKEKFDALAIEKKNLESQLNEANSKLEGYDPEWKAKADLAKKKADEEIDALKRDYAVREQVSALRFSSESAKRAFLAEVKAKALPVQDGKVLGLDDFVKQYREADPGAFLSEEKPPKYSGPTPGVVSAATGKDKANAAIRELLSRQ